ncbi:hypothetical protein NP493_229g01055 [Ridgeia piscesae]|uniref:Uncharacterized protein n=1 Tax=Ridgeia piscesae TaxID=27915 RepID=A0AAD9NZZ4_RIDPI|nr:hypothetical protein NP493_229g01055 [Ridgeia piscesae]
MSCSFTGTWSLRSTFTSPFGHTVTLLYRDTAKQLHCYNFTRLLHGYSVTLLRHCTLIRKYWKVATMLPYYKCNLLHLHNVTLLHLYTITLIHRYIGT